MSVDVVAGARPNFVKVAPILRALQQAGIENRLIHTGQHHDESLSGAFFKGLGIREPDVALGVGSGPHGAQTGAILARYEQHLLSGARPRCVVVVGDVNSTLASALAAVKLGIPVAHVEAGLRSFDRLMPEEVNRVLTDAMADLLLVSEPAGEENLRREGIPGARIRYVGNVMIDSLVAELTAARAARVPESLGLPHHAYAYATFHRPSNVDAPARLEALVRLLEVLARQQPVALPLHPRTEAALEAAGLLARARSVPGLHLLPPLPYRDALSLLASARVVITDSGGLQEEAAYLDVPCLTVRASTERPVTVALGTNTVVGEELERVPDLVEAAAGPDRRHAQPIPGWDGHAADRIVAALRERYAV